jgi:hypothetical protein
MHARFQSHGETNIGATAIMIWQQVLIALALMTATIPCLKGFLGRFKTSDLARLSEYQSTYVFSTNNNTRRRNHNRSYALSTMNREGGSRQRRNRSLPSENPTERNDKEHSVTAFSEGSRTGDNTSERSFGSERMIIHRRFDFDVSAQ